MGQYYMPTLISEDGSIRILNSHAYDNGLKLMEHSYIGNTFVNAVLTLLWKAPCRLAWIGDYSDEEYGDPYEAKLSHEDFMKYYDVVWRGNYTESLVQPEPRSIHTMSTKRGYLVNHTLKVFIPIKEYIAANIEKGRGRLIAPGRIDPFYTYDMCLHPLPLLTACGNGRGCGDYCRSSTDSDLIGSWAFDLIEATSIRPAGYERRIYHFATSENAA